MPDAGSLSLAPVDYLAFGAYFVVLCGIGLWAGRRERTEADDYFLAGRSLPWYVVGSSFIASNISTEHFIGMIGVAFLFGICVAMSEWANVATFSILIWFFIPFLLRSGVFTTPEFMERRFSPILRQLFAIVTVLSNVVAFLAAVLYGGGTALEALFGWPLWLAIVALGTVAGSWAIYGGLSSVAWTDFFTVVVMIAGGVMVTILGLNALAGDGGSLVDGWRTMIERNRAAGPEAAAYVGEHVNRLGGDPEYDRLSVIQPVTHPTHPWPTLIFNVFAISIWYNVINQFMIQRVLGARNMYHARMGIVLAGYMKVVMPFIVVVPGLILFAMSADMLTAPWSELEAQADRGYVQLLGRLIPAGLCGLFLAALFGAIQSTVNSVLNSTATILTLDIYRRWLRPAASQEHLVMMGMISSVAVLALAMVLAYYISDFKGGLFIYIQSLYAFFAPPFSAVFLLGILFRRINAQGALATVIGGFIMGAGLKVLVGYELPGLEWLAPYPMQAIVNWVFCVVVCVTVSLLTAPPAPEQVTEQLTINWRKLNLFEGLGERWYASVVLWWVLFVLLIAGLMVVFSGRWL